MLGCRSKTGGRLMSEKTWGVASYTLVGTAFLAAGAYVAWRCDVKSSDIASWVQAFGSIGAIVGAFVLGKKQADDGERRELAAKAREDAESLQAIMQLAERAEHFAEVILPACRKQSGSNSKSLATTMWARMYSPISKQLEGIPLHRMPYARLATEVIGMLTCIEYFSVATQKFAASSSNDGAEFKDVEVWQKRILRMVDRFRTKLQREPKHMLEEETDS